MTPQTVVGMDPAARRLVGLPGAELVGRFAEAERAAVLHRIEVTGGLPETDVGLPVGWRVVQVRGDG
jgi:hypothetical protein